MGLWGGAVADPNIELLVAEAEASFAWHSLFWQVDVDPFGWREFKTLTLCRGQ
jgi:hypothetical protein